MSKKRTLRQVAVALMLLVAFLFQGTWALAGTTGGIGGVVTDDNGAPVAAADVKVVSPAQSSEVQTDNAGRFTFISLAPDTYTVSIEKTGYNPTSYAGVTVFADQQVSLAFKLTKALKEIAKVSARAATSLIKPGTTSDVYSVNASTAAKITGLGGGGGLDNAYSAIASVPGAYVPVGQAGWYQNVYIRGGDYDQVGYEVDGVPVNRSFDNYASNTASALGQQEVQVYTGAAPSNAEGQGLSGFINQTIKAGTFPGFATTDLGIGGPTYYHKANVEVGGATPDRLFSYYAGFGGYNQDFRVIDQNNGVGLQNIWGTPFQLCPGAPVAGQATPGCYDQAGAYHQGLTTNDPATAGVALDPWFILGPYQVNAVSTIADRENVLNFHFGIQHKHDGGRDDVQALYQASDLKTWAYLGQNDWGPGMYGTLYGPGGAFASYPNYVNGLAYTGSLNQPLNISSPTASAPVITYGFPSVPNNGGVGPLPGNLRDGVDNAVGIVKLQYQKNFSSDAYLRVYGYSIFSNWFNYGPNSAVDCCTGSIPTDYELSSHTRGVSATFAKQLNAKNLIQAQASYITASSLRDNNTPFGFNAAVGIAVDANNPTSGICYDVNGAPANCDHGAANAGGLGNKVDRVTAAGLQAYQGGGAAPVLPATCGGGPCEFLTAENGQHATYNTVTPKFSAFSLTDEWDPSDRLHFNLGVRLDNFKFDPSTTQGGSRDFWFNAWNNSYCASTAPGSNPVEKFDPTLPCTSANLVGNPVGTFVPATMYNTDPTTTYNVFQPRVGITYTANPTNVFRFSYGKYDQAPNTAFEQYNTLQQNLPGFLGPTFYGYGFTSTVHPVSPEVSYNTDFSWEHQFKGSDVSFKLSPFYRKTNDQIQQFFLNLKTNFVSGLNVGQQTSDGLEFQLQKGDFSRNGFAALLSYAYTNSYIQYQPLSNGSTVVSGLNTQIANYNSYTSFCAANASDPRCAGTNGTVAAPCYNAGVPVSNPAACTATTTANPYWNAPVQALLDPNGKYAPYDLFPGGSPGAGSYESYVAPHVATLVLNYKHDKWAITPAIQFRSGPKYGFPLAAPGIAPDTCASLGTAPDAARYPYGGSGGAYDASNCGQLNAIPNPDTGAFDGIGAFREPNRYTMNMQLSYDVNPRVSAVLTLANIFDVCSGGTTGSWTNVPGVSKSKICAYGAGLAGIINPVGNVYNPGTAIQPFQAHTYSPAFGSLPFDAYFDLKIKL